MWGGHFRGGIFQAKKKERDEGYLGARGKEKKGNTAFVVETERSENHSLVSARFSGRTILSA